MATNRDCRWNLEGRGKVRKDVSSCDQTWETDSMREESHDEGIVSAGLYQFLIEERRRYPVGSRDNVRSFVRCNLAIKSSKPSSIHSF